jgi:hypothetical protein
MPKFEKGSEEAKEWGKMMRAKRTAKAQAVSQQMEVVYEAPKSAKPTIPRKTMKSVKKELADKDIYKSDELDYEEYSD